MDVGVTQGLAIADYVVFIGLLASSLMIGVYYGFMKKQTSNSDYLVGGRKMPVFPTAMSLLASYISAILILGVPSELFYHGTLLWETLYNNILIYPLAAYIFIPTFYKLQLTSVYEYLELRFKSRTVRWIASITCVIQSLLYLGVVVYAPSIALYTVAGFPYWASILCIGGVGTLYTAMGGLKAVVWTDVLQGCLMFGGLLAIIIQGSIEIGGFGKAFEINNKHGRLQFLDFNPSPFVRHSTFACFFGDAFRALALYGCQQTSVQRYCSMSSLRRAVMSLLLNTPLVTFIVCLAWIAGIVMFANYADCDPLTAGFIRKKDEIVPFFVLHKFSFLPGMLGLFVASLFSGALSSVSSLLNALAAIAWEDFLKNIPKFKGMGSTAQLRVTKTIGFLFGGVIIGIAFAVSSMTGLIQTTITLSGAVSGPLLGVFLLALLCPCTNKYGAIFGMLVGHAVAMWIGFGSLMLKRKPPFLPLSVEGCNSTFEIDRSLVDRFSNITMLKHASNTFYNVSVPSTITPPVSDIPWPEKIYTVSYLYYCMIGCLVTMFLGILISYITGPTSAADIDPELLHPLVQKFQGRKKNPRKKSSVAMVEFPESNVAKFNYKDGEAKKKELESTTANGTSLTQRL